MNFIIIDQDMVT